MRRFVLLTAASLAVLPLLAMAQTTPNPPHGPGPGTDGSGMMGGPGVDGPGMMGGPGWQHDGRHPEDPVAFLMKFYAANTTHDGHLTLAQAKAAGLKPVADNFTEIDIKKQGFVTPYDIEAWRLDDIAKRMEQRADQLRAQD